MRIHQERQLNPVADEVLALTAVVRPILKGVLSALKEDVASQAGGRENISLAFYPGSTAPETEIAEFASSMSSMKQSAVAIAAYWNV